MIPLGGDVAFRTPMTHTMEVVSVAVSIALSLGLNQQLVTAIALGHYLGAPALGRPGAGAFLRLAGESGLAIFPINHVSLYIVNTVPDVYSFKGLNLTSHVRDGILNAFPIDVGAEFLSEIEPDPDIRVRFSGLTTEALLVRAVVPIVSCAYALDDLLQAAAVPGEQLRGILNLSLFRGVPLVEKFRGTEVSGSALVKMATEIRALLIREFLRFGKLQAIENVKTREELEKLAEPDSSVQGVQDALDRVYGSLFLSDSLRSRTERILEALYRNAAKDTTGWDRLIRLFDIAALTDGHCRLQFQQTVRERAGIEGLVQDIQEVTSAKIVRPDIFIERSLGRLSPTGVRLAI